MLNKFIKNHSRSDYLRIALVLMTTAFVVFCCSSDGGDGTSESDNNPAEVSDDTPRTSLKEVEVISDSSSPLLVMATDENDVSFWFYAVRSAQGVPEYINELVLTEMAGDDIQEIISISFDERQRIIKVTLPDLQGEMTLDYISSDEVEVRVSASDGTSETITVPYTYAATNATRRATGAVQDALCRDWAGWPQDDVQTWIGVIEACKVGPKPTARVFKYNNSGELTGHYFAQVRPMDQSILPGYYEFTYQIALVDDYEIWESHCLCMHNITIALLAIDVLVGPGEGEGSFFSEEGVVFKNLSDDGLFNLGNTLRNFAEGIVGDIMDGSGSPATLTVAESTGEFLTMNGAPGTAREVAEHIYNGIVYGALPCSEELFTAQRESLMEEIEIEVKYSGKEKTKYFDPDSDSEIPQTSFAEMCCGNVTEAGGDEPETHEHELGLRRGEFLFEYETYSIKDQIIVIYEGNWLFDSGCVGTRGYKSSVIPYQGSSHKVKVQVFPNCEEGTSGTAWEYKITCPEPQAQ